MNSGSVNRSFVWDYNSLNILITMYETHANLYKTNDPNYKLKNKRLDALNDIQKVLFENGFKVSIEEINKKIHNLRTQFFKEVAKTKKSGTSGAGKGDMYVPRAWWYEPLKFLINSDPVRQSESNLQSQSSTQDIGQTSATEDDDNIEEVILLEVDENKQSSNFVVPDDTMPTASNSAKRRSNAKARLVDETTSIIQKASSALSDLQNKKILSDDLTAFGNTIVAEMRKIKDPMNIRCLKRKIFDAVLDAQQEED